MFAARIQTRKGASLQVIDTTRGVEVGIRYHFDYVNRYSVGATNAKRTSDVLGYLLRSAVSLSNWSHFRSVECWRSDGIHALQRTLNEVAARSTAS